MSDKGRRAHFENSTNIHHHSSILNDSNIYSFSLFDGHLGQEAAKFCTEHLHQYVAEYLVADHGQNISDSITKGFKKCDNEFKKYAVDNQCEAGAVGVYTFYTSTAVYIANVGDCKAILCSSGKVKELTIDHNLKNEAEKKKVL